MPSSVHFCQLTPSTTVWDEVQRVVWASVKSVYLAASMVGDARGLLMSLARGRLPESDPRVLEPVATQPDLWELKLHEGKRWQFRFYHAEPGSDPDIVVLLFHRKVTDGPSETVTVEQNRQMARASRRYKDGLGARWGHKRPDCPGCLGHDL